MRTNLETYLQIHFVNYDIFLDHAIVQSGNSNGFNILIYLNSEKINSSDSTKFRNQFFQLQFESRPNRKSFVLKNGINYMP